MVFDNQGNVYFTDSGPMGETSIANPRGSLFCVDGEQQMLRPLAYECLAHPCGLALSGDHQTLFVAETMHNRVLRFAQSPPGSFHMSVVCTISAGRLLWSVLQFYQFSGRLGPTALTYDSNSGNLYVGHSDFKGATSRACQPLSTLSRDRGSLRGNSCVQYSGRKAAAAGCGLA